MQLTNKTKALITLSSKWCAVFLLFNLILGCNSSTDDESILAAPSDFFVTSVLVGADSDNPNGDGSGKVDFTISATNATSYRILINNETLEFTENTFSYTFTDSGTNEYTVTVTAINSAGSRSTIHTITVLGSNLDGLQLVWSDEFDGNGPIDASKWTFDTGGGGWGNGESQVYTSDESNVVIEDGILKINAINDTGSASATTYYFDELTLLDAGGNTVSIIENFEGTAPELDSFDGASTQVIVNPSVSGENTTSNVVEFEKTLGASGNAGVWWDNNTAIDVSVNNKMSLKTWSPESGVVVRLKLENSADSSQFHLVDASTSVSSAWETLIYDFSGAPAYTYDRLVVFFDHGTNLANYTSGRIKTEGLYGFTYGTVEVRAKLPASQGTWPAIWMLGSNISTVGWPACGEIDIMEQTGWDKTRTSAALHMPGNFGGNAIHGDTENSTSTTAFNIYKVEWTATDIKVLVNDTEFFTFVNTTVTPYNLDHFLILNVALGGTLGGTIDPNFTQDTMEIDYVRVYQ